MDDAITARVARLRTQRDTLEKKAAAERADLKQRLDDAEIAAAKTGHDWAMRASTHYELMQKVASGSPSAVQEVVWPNLISQGFATAQELDSSGAISMVGLAYQAAFIEAVNEILRKVQEDA
jgi:hypothetical protein